MATFENHRRVQFPRAGTARVDDYVGLQGELSIDTDRNELRLHDSRTPGGHRILNFNQMKSLFMTRDSEFGKLAFPQNAIGFMVRIGNRKWALRSMAVADGLTMSNGNGKAGNPTIGLPARLDPYTTSIDNCNAAKTTGWYRVNKTAANRPLGIGSGYFGGMMVIASNSTNCIQMYIGEYATAPEIWVRRCTDGKFFAWIQMAAELGTQALLKKGVDTVPRLWTAKDLTAYVKDIVADAVKDMAEDSDDNATVPTLFIRSKVTSASGSQMKAGGTTNVHGPTQLKIGDRLEFNAGVAVNTQDDPNARVPSRKSCSVEIEVETSANNWVKILETSVSLVGDGRTQAEKSVGIIRQSANTFYVTDENWSIVSTRNSSLTGRIRVKAVGSSSTGRGTAPWNYIIYKHRPTKIPVAP